MKKDYNGFTPQRTKSSPCTPSKPTTPLSASEKKTIPFHSPCNNNGDSPYAKAKHVQLIERDPRKAVSLFWSAINSGDRIDSAVKDMALVMHQLNRVEEAIEAIKSFRSLCSQKAQDSLDNVLIDLYKRAGRIDEHIELLQHKLQLVEDGVTYGGKRTKIARAQGKKQYCSIEQEKSKLLGNLGWAYMRQENYQVAEEFYRKALSIEPDKNKQCNLAICLMHKGRIMEAKSLLQTVKSSMSERELADSYIKSFDRATEMLSELDSGPDMKPPEQKKDDNIKMETQGSFTYPLKVNPRSHVSSGYEDKENNEPGAEWDGNMSGSDSSFGNWKPFSSSKSGMISWADMVEEEEEERLSGYSDYSASIIESVGERSSENSNYVSQETHITPTQLKVDKWVEKTEAAHSDNLTSVPTYQQLSSANDMERNLQRKLAAVDINGEVRKSAARRSLYI